MGGTLKLFLILSMGASAFAAPLLAPDTLSLVQGDPSQNFYVRLWASRWRRAKLSLALAQADKKLADARLNRRDKLSKTRNVSITELNEARRDGATATAALASSEARVREAEAMLALASAHDAIGKKIPICLELQ